MGVPPAYVVPVQATFLEANETGTGIIVDRRATILTCEHVVVSKTVAAAKILVRLPYPVSAPVPYTISQRFSSHDLVLLRPLVPVQSQLAAAIIDWEWQSHLDPNDAVELWGFSTGDIYTAPQPTPSVIRGFDAPDARIGLTGSVNLGDSGGAVLRKGKLIAIIQGVDCNRAAHALAIPITLLPPDVFAPAETIDLPEVTPAFTGRDNDVRRIVDALSARRFVTLTGIGGIGKTECAKAVALDAVGNPWSNEGVRYFGLESAKLVAEVETLMRQALGLTGGEVGLAQLAAAIRGSKLIVLDDVHQALMNDGRKLRQFVRELFFSTKPARFLVTCRRDIGVHDIEHVLQLQRLDPPEDANLLRKLMDSYSWREGDEQQFITLLDQLDGFALAIRIAGDLLRDSSLTEVLSRWHDRRTAALQLPGIGPQELDKLTSVDFSLAVSISDLTDADSRTLLGAMWLLPAGATPATFDAVLGRDSSEARSILQRGAFFLLPKENRYTTLVPVREFSVHILQKVQRDTVRERIDAYLLTYAEKSSGDPIAWRKKPSETAAIVAAELPNLQAALDRAETRNDNLYLARLTNAMRKYYPFAMPGKPAQARLTRAIEAAKASGERLLEANLLYALADLGWIIGGVNVRDAFEGARGLYESLGERALAASALWSVSFADLLDGDFEAVIRRNVDALKIFEELGDDDGRGLCIKSIGDAERLLKRLDDAERHYTQALTLLRRCEHLVAEAETLRQLGEVALARSKGSDPALLDIAAQFHKDALTVFQRAGHAQGAAHCTHELGVIEAERGDYDRALLEFAEAKRAFDVLGDEMNAANTLVSMARAWNRKGDRERAAEMASRALDLFERLSLKLEKNILDELCELQRAVDAPAGSSTAPHP